MIKPQRLHNHHKQPAQIRWNAALQPHSWFSARAARPRWLRALLLVGLVALLALVGAALGRGFGQPATMIEQAFKATASPLPGAIATTPVALPATTAASTFPAATPAALPTPTLANWPIVLDERFEQPAPAWPEVLGPSWHTRYRDGGYELTLERRPSFSTSAALRARDFQLSADVQIHHGQAGLFFLLGRPNDFYRLLIDTSGRYRLECQQVGAARALIDWTSSPALHTGAARNRLEVQRIGAMLTLAANGQQLTSYTLSPGNELEARVGIALDAPPGEQQAHALFDNIEVRTPPTQ